MSKYTKGNWAVLYSAAYKGFQTFEVEMEGCDFKEKEANAKIIAAAPDLLEALKDMIEWANIKDGSPSQYLRDAAQLAIKKATE